MQRRWIWCAALIASCATSKQEETPDVPLAAAPPPAAAEGAKDETPEASAETPAEQPAAKPVEASAKINVPQHEPSASAKKELMAGLKLTASNPKDALARFQAAVNADPKFA